MTVSVKDKIELFRSIIFRDIKESASEKKNQTARNFEREKSRLIREIGDEKSRIAEEAEKKAEKEKKQLVEKVRVKGYHQLLIKKQQFIDQIIGLIVREAGDYVSEEGYREYLSKSLRKTAEVFENANLIELYFTKRDLEELSGFIRQDIASGKLNGRCQMKEAEQNIIGGFYAEDSKHEIQIDYTLKSLIEEKRELIGNSISRRFDEV
ncbi:MAG TPA: V-type ATP synthase subunit E family protein [Bacillota bacterium]|nr:V-type ATP synthase subunit E family protein [Bacillota bacterium]